MKAVVNLGDRIVFDVTESATQDLTVECRRSEGVVTGLRLRFAGSPREAVDYTVLLDRPILGNREWRTRADPGQLPSKLRKV